MQKSEHNDLLVSVGHALHSWSMVECALENTFAALSGTDLTKSHLIMGSIIQLETRLRICSNLIADAEVKEHLKTFWTRAADRIARQAEKRNALAHFSLVEEHGPGTTGGPTLIPYYSIGRMVLSSSQPKAKRYRIQRLGVPEIIERIGHFNDLTIALYWFSDELGVEQGRLATNIQPVIDLVHHLLRPIDPTPQEPKAPRQSFEE